MWGVVLGGGLCLDDSVLVLLGSLMPVAGVVRDFITVSPHNLGSKN